MEGGDEIMASKIDKRIVQMNFDNSKFEKGIKTTLNSLAKLKSSLNFQGASKGLKEIENAGKKVNFSALEKAVSLINKRFSTFGIISTTALQEVTKAAINAGVRIKDALTGQIISGGKTRALNIEQAKFMFEGLGMDIEKSMASANAAVKGTAYGLDQAAKAAGQFGASGMRAGDEMTSALRAIAGVASMTSSDYDSIANIFTAVAGQGRVMGDQLLQLSQRGINVAATLGKQLGKTEKEIREMVSDGEISFEVFYKAMDYAFGEQATKANKTFTGALSNMKAALSRIGADVATPTIETLRKTFNTLTPFIDNVHAALMPAINTIATTLDNVGKSVRKSINSIDQKSIEQIGKSFSNLFIAVVNGISFSVKGFKAFKKGLSEVLPVINLLDFKKVTRSIRDFVSSLEFTKDIANKFKMIGASIGNIIVSIENVAGAVYSIVKPAILGILDGILPLKESLSDLIPNGLINVIYEITTKIREFTEGLIISDETAEVIRNTFKSLSTILSSVIGVVINLAKVIGTALFNALNLISPIGKVLVDIFKAFGSILLNVVSSVISPVSKGIKNLSSILSEYSKEVRNSLEKSEMLKNVINGLKGAVLFITSAFEKLGKIIATIAGGAFVSLISIFSDLGDNTNTISTNFKSTGTVISNALYVVASSAEKAKNGLTNFINSVKGVLSGVFSFLSPFIELIKRVISQINLDDILSVGSMVSTVKIFKSIENAFKSFEKATSGVTAALKGIGGALEEYQKNIKADTIKKIAVSVALLSASIVALTLIKPENLASGFAAMTGLIAELVIAMKFINDLKVRDKDIIKVSISMIAVASALDILASALKKLENFKTIESIIPSLTGITILLAGITAAMVALIRELEKVTKENIGSDLIKAGASMVLIATALNILASACKKLGETDIASLAKGGVAVVLLMSSLSKFKNIYSDGSYAGLALVIMSVSTSMLLLHKAIVKLAGIPYEEMHDGLSRVKNILMGLFLFLKGLEGAKMEGVAATILALSVALNLLLVPIRILGGMQLDILIQGLLSTAAALVGIGLALKVIGNASVGLSTSASILALAIALNALVIPITILGALPWLNVALGVGALAVSIFALGGIMAILSPFATGMLLVSAAFGAFGASIALVGGGILAIAAGLTMLTAALAANNLAFMGFLAMIPAIIAELAGILNIIASLAPGIGENLKKIGIVIVDTLAAIAKEAIVKVVELVATLINEIIKQLTSSKTLIIKGIGDILRAIINEITKTIPNIAKLGVTLITEFVKSLANSSSQLVKSGVEIINNILKGIQQIIPEIVNTGVTFINELLKGIEKVVPQLMSTITTIGKNILKTLREIIPDLVNTGLALLMALLNGIKNNIGNIVKTAADIVINFINGIAEKLPDIINAGINMMLSFIEGLAQGIDENSDRAVNAVFDLFEAIVKLIIQTIKKLPEKLLEWGAKAIKGLIEGFKSFRKNIWPTIKDIIDGIIERIKELPGKLVQAGKDAIEGFIKGIKDKIFAVKDAVADVGKKAVNTIKDFLGIHSPSRVMAEIGRNTVTGYVNGIAERQHEVIIAMKNLAKPVQNFADEIVKSMTVGGAAVKTFYNSLKDSGASKKEFNQAIKDMALSMDAFTKSLYKNSDYYKEDINNTKELKQRYKELQKEEQKLKKEQGERLADLKKAQAEVAKARAEERKEKEKETAVAKGEDPLVKILEERQKKTKETGNVTKTVGESVSKSVKNVTDTIKSSNSEQEKSDNKTTETKTKNTKTKISLDEEDAKSVKKTSSTRKTSVESEKKSYQDTTNKIKENLKEQEKVRKQFAENEKKIIENQKKALKDWQENIKNAMRSYIDLSKASTETGLSLTDAFTIDTSLTTQEALKNSKENLKAYQTWLEDLKKLSAMGYDEAIVQTAKDAGYQNQSYLKALMGATKEEVDQFNKDMRASQKLSAEKVLSDAKEKMNQIKEWSANIEKMSAKGFSQSLIQSLVDAGPEASAELANVYANMTATQVKEINKFEKSSEKSINKAVNTITYSTALAGSNGASNAARKFVQSYSDTVGKEFSKTGVDSAKKSVSSIGSTISKESKKVGKKSGKTMVTSFLSGMEEEAPKAKKQTKDFSDRMAQGIDNSEWVEKAGKTLASEITTEFQNAGEKAGKSFEKGVEESTDNATDAVKEFSDKIKSSLESYLDLSKVSSSISLSLTDAFKVDTSMTTEEALKNSRNNILGYKKWLQDLQKLLAMGYDEAIVQTVKDAGYQNQSYLKALMGATKEEIEQFNKDIREKQKLSADQILADAKERNKKVQEWSLNIQKMAAKGFSDSLIQSIAEAGPEASAELASVYANMTEAQVREINTYEKTTSELIGNVTKAITTQAATVGATGAETAAKELVTTYAKEVSKPLVTQVSSAAAAGLTSVESAMVKTSDKAGKKSGKKLVGSFMIGMEDEAPKLAEASKSLANTVVAELKEIKSVQDAGSALTKSIFKDFQESGREIGEATADAIIDGTIDELDDSVDEAAKAVEEFSEKIRSSVETFVDPLKVSTSTGIDIFKEFTVETELSGEQLLKNMQSQVAGVKQWKEDLNALAESGLAPEIINKLRELGVSSAEQIQAFKQMTLEEINAANQAMTDAMGLTAEQVLEEQKRKTEQALKWSEDMAKLAGKGISEGLIKGLAEQGIDGSSEMLTAYLSMTPQQVDELNKNYQAALEVPDKVAKAIENNYGGVGENAVNEFANAISTIANDQSQDRQTINDAMAEVSDEVHDNVTTSFYETGQESDENLGSAINRYKNNPIDAAKKLSSSVYSALRTNLNSSSGNGIGWDLIDGMVSAIESGKSRVANAVIDMARAAVEAAKDALDINSPSKEFMKIGFYTVMGMVNGIKNNEDSVTKESTNMVGKLINATQDAINKANLTLNDSINTEPIIRPIVDLDQAMKGVRRLNDELTNKTYNAMEKEIRVRNNGSSNSNSSSSGATIENNYNMVQNNYSPKALSRIDIYRQTKSLFSQFKDEVVSST